MLIEVNKPLVQLNGSPIMDVDSEGKSVQAMVKTAIVNALLAPEQKEMGMDKIRKYILAKKIYHAQDKVEVTAEDVALIKKRVGEVYPPLIVGQIVELLEQN